MPPNWNYFKMATNKPSMIPSVRSERKYMTTVHYVRNPHTNASPKRPG